MTVYLVSQFLNNWCLRKKSTNPWAQVIGQEYMSIPGYEMLLRAFNTEHSSLSSMLWEITLKTCSWDSESEYIKKSSLQVDFQLLRLETKTEAQQWFFFFFLESTATEDSKSPHTGHLVQLSWEICPVFPICTVQQLLVKAPEEILCNLLSQQSWKKICWLIFLWIRIIQ